MTARRRSAGAAVGLRRARPTCLALTGLLAVTTLLSRPATAAESALRKLREGDTVAAKGSWDGDKGVFLVDEIERLPKAHRPSVRGVIESVDSDAARLVILGRDVHVNGETAFLSASGQSGGGLSDLRPGGLAEVTAKVDETGTWTATKVVWRGIKIPSVERVRGAITAIHSRDNSVESVEVSGLRLQTTPTTVFEGDYLEEELLDSLFSDEGDVNTPHLRVGKHLLVSGDLRVTVRREDGYTLSEGEDERITAVPASSLQVAGEWDRAFQTLVDVRLRGEQEWTGDPDDSPVTGRFEARQAYAALRLPRYRGAALLVGKQRVRDGREWLFDEYLDGIRLYVYATRPVVLEASYFPSLLAPRGEKFETWDDLLLRARYIPDSRNEASFYFLKRHDTSARNREPVYWGLSYEGRPWRILRGWLEAALLRGEDKGRPQRAWALDAGATLTARGAVRPSLTVAYALGSGEKKAPDDPFSQEFRQTGHEDNSDRLGGFSTFKYYGEVLDPELSNLKIYTLGAGLRFGNSVSVDGVYHFYRQHRLDDKLQARLDPELSERSLDVGRELDVVLGVRNLWKRVSLSYAFGRFEPGAAFTSGRDPVILHRASVRLAF
jgi:alginate production protein